MCLTRVCADVGFMIGSHGPETCKLVWLLGSATNRAMDNPELECIWHGGQRAINLCDLSSWPRSQE